MKASSAFSCPGLKCPTWVAGYYVATVSFWLCWGLTLANLGAHLVRLDALQFGSRHGFVWVSAVALRIYDRSLGKRIRSEESFPAILRLIAAHRPVLGSVIRFPYAPEPMTSTPRSQATCLPASDFDSQKFNNNPISSIDERHMVLSQPLSSLKPLLVVMPGHITLLGIYAATTCW